MKWFKHENTFNNPKIEVLTEICGIAGYGVYFSLLELIASHIDLDNKDEWGYLPKEYSLEYLSKKLHINQDELQQIISKCIELDLFNFIDNRIYCPKILERCDDYTTRLIKQTTNNVITNSEQTTKSVVKSSSRIEENRIDKNRKEEREITPLPKNSIEYLGEIPPDDTNEFLKRYKITLSQLNQKARELRNYCDMHGKRYKDYKAFLRNSIEKDYGERREEVKKLSDLVQN